MMRQMRENTKWIMLATALAFVGLMVFQWGMDITGRSAGGVGEIGQVNGEPVLLDDYQAALRNLTDQAQNSQQEPLTSQQLSELEDQAWDQTVNQILIRQELDRRGIQVTDDEIRQAARYSPPPALAQNAAFMTAGQFDFQKYQTFLAQQADDQFLLSLEAYYRDIIPRSKLLRQVSSGIYLTDQLLWQRWTDQNETVEIRYIPLNPSQRIPDDSIQISDSEIQAYYDEHQDDFEQPARAQVKVAVISKIPTAADSAASLEHADELAAELQDGADFADVAERETGNRQSADLGVLTKGQTGVPVFDSVLFAAPVGRVVGPVRSPVGYHILRVDERWGQDSASAHHVLVPIERTDSSELALLTMADSLEELGTAMTLEEAASQLGLEVQDANLTASFPVVSGAGQIGEGADWALEEAAPGDVSPVFENSQAFYSVELVSRTPGGVLPLENARASIRQILGFQKKLARVETEGEALVQKIRSGAGLPNTAAEAGLEVRSAGPFARNDFVAGIGRYNAAVGAAFGLQQPGEVSDVVTTPDNAFIIELVARNPADSAQWLEQKDAQRTQVQNLLQQQYLQEWLESLRNSATVVDRRDEVLRPADESQPLQQPTGRFGR